MIVFLPRSRARRGLAIAVGSLMLVACSASNVSSTSTDAHTAANSRVSDTFRSSGRASARASSGSSPGASTASATPARKQVSCSTAVQLAFGGDVNTANDADRVLTAGLGSAGVELARADRAMVNTETVFADDRSGLVAQPKKYNFVAPTRLLDVLAQAGVDVVTMANNHGLDYGQAGLAQTLAAASPSRPRMIGAGDTITAAFAPARSTVRGRGVVFFAATDVIDDGLPWAATADQPGLASIKTSAGLERLRTAVRSDRARHPCDVISVYLHAGVELTVCPTDRQRLVAADLAADGADVVLMSHAHVVQPGQVIGHTAVDYGLGNLVFAGHSPLTTQTGVLSVEVPKFGAPRETWHPGRIVDGLPQLFTGSQAQYAAAQWQALGRSC